MIDNFHTLGNVNQILVRNIQTSKRTPQIYEKKYQEGHMSLPGIFFVSKKGLYRSPRYLQAYHRTCQVYILLLLHRHEQLSQHKCL